MDQWLNSTHYLGTVSLPSIIDETA